MARLLPVVAALPVEVESCHEPRHPPEYRDRYSMPPGIWQSASVAVRGYSTSRSDLLHGDGGCRGDLRLPARSQPKKDLASGAFTQAGLHHTIHSGRGIPSTQALAHPRLHIRRGEGGLDGGEIAGEQLARRPGEG